MRGGLLGWVGKGDETDLRIGTLHKHMHIQIYTKQDWSYTNATVGGAEE